MSTPARITADIIGATVFSIKQATLEWTPDGRIKIVQVEPGEPPVVVIDSPPQALKRIVSVDLGQPMLVFEPQQGPKVKLSLQRSMLAPEPNESADAYARRQAMVGVPPQSWWKETLQAAGANVVTNGGKQTFIVAGVTSLAIILLIVGIVVVVM